MKKIVDLFFGNFTAKFSKKRSVPHDEVLSIVTLTLDGVKVGAQPGEFSFGDENFTVFSSEEGVFSFSQGKEKITYSQQELVNRLSSMSENLC